MKHFSNLSALALFSAVLVFGLLVLAGCNTHAESDLQPGGSNAVAFVAASSGFFSATPSTRTIFGGETFTVSTGGQDHRIEHINWVDSDKITVGEAHHSGQVADFLLTPRDGKPAEADFAPVSGQGIEWIPASPVTDAQYFWFMALYPSMNVDPSRITFTQIQQNNKYSMDISSVDDVMPSTQWCYANSSRANENWYEPNMKYAYMTAIEMCAFPSGSFNPSTGRPVSSPSPVSLKFNPAFSSVEVKLLKPSYLSDVPVYLKSATLTAGSGSVTSQELSGSPAITRTGTSTVSVSDALSHNISFSGGTAGNAITIYFRESKSATDNASPELSSTKPTSFTFLLLPEDVNQLELTLALEIDGDHSERRMKLQSIESGGNTLWIQLPAGKKLTVSNMETWSIDEISGGDAFSVSANHTVNFSPGNLRATIKTNGSSSNAEWRFADNQYDYAGSYSSSLNDIVDYFVRPGADTDTYRYGIVHTGEKTDYIGTTAMEFLDWGMNEIYENSTATTAYPANTYRTPKRSEWIYLLNERSGPKAGEIRIGSETIPDCRYSMVTVEGVYGMMVYPDGFVWKTANGPIPDNFNGSVRNGTSYSTTNSFSGSSWAALENAGVVFLPAAGFTDNTAVTSAGTAGRYMCADKEAGSWLSSSSDDGSWGALDFSGNYGSIATNNVAYNLGCSVRLVKDGTVNVRKIEISHKRIQLDNVAGTPEPSSATVTGTIHYMNGHTAPAQIKKVEYGKIDEETEDSDGVSGVLNYHPAININGSTVSLAKWGGTVLIQATDGYTTSDYCFVGANAGYFHFINATGGATDRTRPDFFQKAKIASGNLQCRLQNGNIAEWRIAPNPWDYLGERSSANTTINADGKRTGTGWVDLFTWSVGSRYRYGVDFISGNLPTRNEIQMSFSETDFVGWGTLNIAGLTPSTGWVTPHCNANSSRALPVNSCAFEAILGRGSLYYQDTEDATPRTRYMTHSITVNSVEGHIVIPTGYIGAMPNSSISAQTWNTEWGPRGFVFFPSVQTAEIRYSDSYNGTNPYISIVNYDSRYHTARYDGPNHFKTYVIGHWGKMYGFDDALAVRLFYIED